MANRPFVQPVSDNQLNFYPKNLLLSPKKGWKMISMLLVWDPTTKLEFSFKIIRSDFVEEVEKRLTEAWEFRDTSSQKDAGCGLALITRWTGPTQVTLACLPKNRHLSRWNVCAPVVFFHLSKIRELHEEPIFVHSAMHLNGSEMVKGGLLRRNWRTHYHKRSFWHGRRNLRK